MNGTKFVQINPDESEIYQYLGRFAMASSVHLRTIQRLEEDLKGLGQDKIALKEEISKIVVRLESILAMKDKKEMVAELTKLSFELQDRLSPIPANAKVEMFKAVWSDLSVAD